MNTEFEYKKKLVIGLIIIFALSFFCAGVEMIKRDFSTKPAYVAEKKEEPEEKKEIVIDPNKPMIALTFDDGPSKYTMDILNQLESYGARATFFMLGTNVPKFPETVKKMEQIGCEIGNHSTKHAKLTELTPDLIMAEIAGTNTALTEILGKQSTVFRPPYGAVDANVSAIVDVPIILWSVDTLDWQTKNSEQVRDYILNTVQDGDIVLLHDLYETTAQAVAEVIPRLIEQGYQLVTVSEMARTRGITLESATVYGKFRKEY